jgi:hypothetical protein
LTTPKQGGIVETIQNCAPITFEACLAAAGGCCRYVVSGLGAIQEPENNPGITKMAPMHPIWKSMPRSHLSHLTSQKKSKSMKVLAGEENQEPNKGEELEKNKVLYNSCKEMYDEEKNRFLRTDEKASKYLSAMTLLLGAYGFFANWLISN